MSAHGSAVVAKRGNTTPVTTHEIERLATAAGYDVVRTHTQARPEDGQFNLGPGKAETVAESIATHDADCLVVDNDLTPTQTNALAALAPAETTVMDRYRLVVEIFADGVGDTRAATQVELARLEYDLPRIRDRVGARDHGLSKRTEKGTPLHDVEDRIDTLRRRLAEITDRAAERRATRREQGFDLVALAGYTNAGKSTLLHRLADDLSLEEYGTGHDDLDETAAIEDRLFRTLETTSRRATIAGRRCIVTDTVGLVDELPVELVESFDATLSAATEADLTVVVADVSDEPSTVRRRLETSLSILEDARRTLVVLNKVDRISDADLAARVDAIDDLVADPVPVSATEGNLTALASRVDAALPTHETETVELPQGGATQQFLAWVHDHASVEATEYTGETVTVTYTGRPEVIAQARTRYPD
ncbi:MAG: HflX GTPase family protein [Halobacteriaceae archaeon]